MLCTRGASEKQAVAPEIDENNVKDSMNNHVAHARCTCACAPACSAIFLMYSSWLVSPERQRNAVNATLVTANGRALAPLCENHRLIVDSSTDRASRVSTRISGGVQRPRAPVNRSHLPGRRSHRACPYRARGIVEAVASLDASPLRLDRLLCVFCLRLRRRDACRVSGATCTAC